MTYTQRNSLKHLNTFGVEASCKGIHEVQNVSQAQELLKNSKGPFRIIGGGSNLLLKGDLDSYVIHNQIKSIDIRYEDDDVTFVRVGGGVVWHDFIGWCLDQELGGMENLSLIPGYVGAAPIQNIGAYGVEQSRCFVQLEAINLETGEVLVFHEKDCDFGYRDSIFKKEWAGKLLITHVTYKLSRKQELVLSYGAVSNQLEAQGITEPTFRDVSNVIIDIRKSKLPDPSVIGNSGSFFKNPIVHNDRYQDILRDYPEAPSYPIDDDHVKLPAGWLIDRCGWKGKVVGNTGTYKNQALVLVNHGEATGEEIWSLALDIQVSVKEKFGVEIIPEVNVWG